MITATCAKPYTIKNPTLQVLYALLEETLKTELHVLALAKDDEGIHVRFDSDISPESKMPGRMFRELSAILDVFQQMKVAIKITAPTSSSWYINLSNVTLEQLNQASEAVDRQLQSLHEPQICPDRQ